MFLVTVEIRTNTFLKFVVAKVERIGGHIVFKDRKTGLEKSFPDHMCVVDELPNKAVA